jgi:flagellar motility protein MotE (MotC chaperone)
MAEEEKATTDEETTEKKALTKAEKKAAKKAEKERKKQEKKEAKKAKKMGLDVDKDNSEDEETLGSKILVVFVTLLIILLWLAIFALLIKWDVGGFGSGVLYPVLKDVPYVNRILPKTEEDESESGEASPYATLDEAVEQIKVLELELAEAQSNDNSDYIAELEAENERLRTYEEQQSEFEELRSKFYEEVVFGDSSPDIEEYKEYYESIDPTNAELLYKEVVEQTAYSDEVKSYAATYSSMKPKQAAAMMEEMTGNLELVAEILENMSTDDRAKILDAMDSAFAARLTELMAP